MTPRLPAAGGMMPERSDALEALVGLLADALAPRVAEMVAERLAAPGNGEERGPGGFLLSLDEVVAMMPSSKPAETWRRWLYARLGSRPQVPGAVKLGGAWAFRADDVRAWLERGDL